MLPNWLIRPAFALFVILHLSKNFEEFKFSFVGWMDNVGTSLHNLYQYTIFISTDKDQATARGDNFYMFVIERILISLGLNVETRVYSTQYFSAQ